MPFDPPFVIAPTVVTLALKALDVNNSTNTRIDTDVTSVSSSGFALHCKTWNDSQVFRLEVSWIAHTFAGGVFDSWAPNSDLLVPSHWAAEHICPKLEREQEAAIIELRSHKPQTWRCYCCSYDLPNFIHIDKHIVSKKHERKKHTAQAPSVKIEYLSGQCASGHLRVRVQLGTDPSLSIEPEQGSTDSPQRNNIGASAQARHILSETGPVGIHASPPATPPPSSITPPLIGIAYAGRSQASADHSISLAGHAPPQSQTNNVRSEVLVISVDELLYSDPRPSLN